MKRKLQLNSSIRTMSDTFGPSTSNSVSGSWTGLMPSRNTGSMNETGVNYLDLGPPTLISLRSQSITLTIEVLDLETRF